MKTEKALLSKKQLLDIFLHHRVDSPFPGDWESIFKGTGFEFWSLRELMPMDSFKNIDWKATAKTGKYYVKEYLAESYYNLMLLYDISQSVAFGRKENLQALMAVSLAYTAISNNNGCGLILFADEVKGYLPARMGWPHFMQILAAIAAAEPVACQTTCLNSALTKLISELPESLTFILSDFLYPFESNYNFLQMTHGTNKHEVKGLQILETFEMKLPENAKGILPLYDLETGRTALMDLRHWAAYNREMEQRLSEIKRDLSRLGIHLLTLTPEDDFALEIRGFMETPPADPVTAKKRIA